MSRSKQKLINFHTSGTAAPSNIKGEVNLGEIVVAHQDAKNAKLFVKTGTTEESTGVATFITDLAIQAKDESTLEAAKSYAYGLKDEITKEGGTIDTKVNALKETVDAYTVNGNAISSNPSLDGSNLTLNQYVKGSSANDIASGDTINEAFGKVQVLIDNLEQADADHKLEYQSLTGDVNTIKATTIPNAKKDVIETIQGYKVNDEVFGAGGTITLSGDDIKLSEYVEPSIKDGLDTTISGTTGASAAAAKLAKRIRLEETRAKGIEDGLRKDLGTNDRTSTTAFARIKNLEDNIGGSGSVPEQISTAIQALDSSIKTDKLNVYQAIKITDGKLDSTGCTTAALSMVTEGASGTHAARYTFKLGSSEIGSVEIPRDRTLLEAKMSRAGATWDSNHIVDGPKGAAVVLVLAYYTSEGKVNLVEIPMSAFAMTAEFKDGLTATDDVVKVLIDPTSQKNYLTVSEAGLKISGIDQAIKVVDDKFSDYYTSEQVDGKLNAKADSSSVYTQEEINGKLNLKLDASTYNTNVGADGNAANPNGTVYARIKQNAEDIKIVKNTADTAIQGAVITNGTARGISVEETGSNNTILTFNFDNMVIDCGTY